MTILVVSDVPVAGITVPPTRRRFADVDGLAASIAEIGLLTPLVVSADLTLIAGLRRLEAVKSLGWETVPASVVPLTGIDAEIAEIDENLVRGQLLVLEEASLAAERKRLYEAKHPETRYGAIGNGRSRVLNDENPTPTFSEDLAEKIGRSVKTAYRLTQIGENIAPDVREVVIAHAPELANSKTQLLELCRLPWETQREVAATIEAGEAVDLRSARRVIDEARRQEKRLANAELVRSAPPLTLDVLDRRYPVVVLDPPWTYRHDYYDRAEPLYAQMSDEAIADLPVPDLAEDDAAVWLWTTQTHHGVAREMLARWGFTLRSELVWVKPRFGMGGWLRSQHETCLLATRGKPERLRADVGTVLEAPLGAHSEKPEAFYEIVESLTSGPFLELFARRQRFGWAYWGAEV